MEKDTKYFIGVVIILLIAIFSFNINKNINSNVISDITGMVTITKEGVCNGACPSECAQQGVSCTSSSCTYKDSICSVCMSLCKSEHVLNPSVCDSECASHCAIAGTKYSCSYEESVPCNDPDGDDIYTKSCGTGVTADGTVYTASSPLCDECMGSGEINEVVCSAGILGKIHHEISAGYRCENGVAVQACNDPDGSNKYTYSCATGVTKGGVVYNDANKLCDVCLSGASVGEIKCSADGYIFIDKDPGQISCGYGNKCQNGACLCTSSSQCLTGYTCTSGVCVAGCSASNCGGCMSKTSCVANNPVSDTFGCGSLTTSTTCSANANCEWFSALESGGFVSVPLGGGATGDVVAVTGTGKKPCQPKTKCVWTYVENLPNKGKCCGDGEIWSTKLNKCQGTSDLCYSFWPDNKEEGKGAKYSDKKVCWNIGSVAYGFWVPVGTY